METRKIALIIFLISLIFLSLGIVVYVVRQRSEVNTLQTNKLSSPANKATPNSPNTSDSTGSATKSGQPITEEQIKEKIEAKKIQITQEAKGRAYTSEELFFIASPRQAVISELEKSK